MKEFNAKQTSAAQKAAMPNTALSRARGYLVDASGKAILDASGKKQILPGFKATGSQVVKVGNTAAAKGTSEFPNLSKAQVQHLRQAANAMRFGITRIEKKVDPQTGKITHAEVHHPPVSYQQAISFAVAEGFSRQDAITMLNRFYPPGVGGRPTKFQRAAAKRVRSANAAARKGNDQTGLGIIVP